MLRDKGLKAWQLPELYNGAGPLFSLFKIYIYKRVTVHFPPNGIDKPITSTTHHCNGMLSEN